MPAAGTAVATLPQPSRPLALHLPTHNRKRPAMKHPLLHTLLATAAILCALPAHAQQQDTIRIGIEGAYPPFNAVDASGKLHGFDVDIAKALCAKIQAKCEYITQDWDGIIPALVARKFDAIISSMVETEERSRKVDFTNSYYRTTLAIAVPKNSKIADVSPAALKGKVMGAQSSTNQSAYAEDHYKGTEIRLYPTPDEAGADLINHRLDAVIHDKLPLVEWLQKNSKNCCKLLGEIPNTEAKTGIAVRKGDTKLRERLNKAIDEIRADGTYQKISHQYFGMDIF